MDQEQKELANNLLRAASERLSRVSGDIPAFNLLSALQIERLETQTHSKIIFYLLKDRANERIQNSFLYLFLRVLHIPEKFLSEKWNVYREKAFASGAGRIDFVMESKSCCAIVEMKIDAGDGDHQLRRYEAFAQKKRKAHILYYLTLDGHAPEEQSADGLEHNKLRCISFRKEIISWLRECMKCVNKDGYQYSFLKQYLGAVRHITDTNDEVISVKDLLSSADMLKAAQLISDGFQEKVEEISAQFFQKIDALIRRKTKLDTALYPNALDIYLKEFQYRKHPYCVKLFVEIDTYLVAGVAFAEITGDGVVTLRLDEAEKTFPSIYRTWMEKLDALENVPRFKRWTRSKYFELEDSRGAKLNFKDYSAQIELIDEMDQQCKYICGYIINLMIKPLLNA